MMHMGDLISRQDPRSAGATAPNSAPPRRIQSGTDPIQSGGLDQASSDSTDESMLEHGTIQPNDL